MHQSISEMASATLPRSIFSTAALRKIEGISEDMVESAWADALSFLQSSKIRDHRLRQKFNPTGKTQGYVNAVPFPSFLALQVAGSGQTLARRADDIATDGLDGILVQCPAQGEILCEEKNSFGHAGPGDVYMVDLAREAEAIVSSFDTYNLLIPRTLMEKEGIDLDRLHLLKLPGNSSLTQIFSQHVQELNQRADTMTISEAEAIVAPTLALLRAAISTTKEDEHRAEPAIVHSHLAQIRNFIDENLIDSALTPELIAHQLGLSRANLYRLAEPLGGIKRFIKNRRLKHAFTSLTKAGAKTVSISNLAYQLGFGSENTFRRAFKEAFGLTPTEAREQGQAALRAYLAKPGKGRQSAPSCPGDLLYKRWTQDLFN